MTNCKICTSEYLGDINKMIANNANDKYIQTWCKQRGFKVTLKAIREYKKESEFLPDEVEFTYNRVYLTKSEINQHLAIDDTDIEEYKKSLNKTINKFDIIELMQFVIHNLRETIKQLQLELNNLITHSKLDELVELKNKKLQEQVRFQTLTASVKEIHLKQLQGKLIDKGLQNEKWSYSFVGFKAKLESIPNKVALQFSSIDDKNEIESILNDLILESIDELNNGCQKTA